MIYFSADLHFFHRRLAEKWGGRPWSHSDFCQHNFAPEIEFNCNCDIVLRMNRGLIDNWNSLVKADDTAYILGDFAFQPNKQKEGIQEIVKKLNGNIKYILGNHDSIKGLMAFGIKEENIFQKSYVILGGIKFLLSHFPYPHAMKEEDKVERPYAQKQLEFENGKPISLLCGHVHDRWMLREHCLNVGVDVHNWHPISENKVLEIYYATKGFTTNFDFYNETPAS